MKPFKRKYNKSSTRAELMMFALIVLAMSFSATVASANEIYFPAPVPSGSVQEEFIQKSQTSALHSGLIPYILGFVIPTNGTPDYFVTDVGINALNSANYGLTGFEVYENGTLLSDVSAEVTDLTAGGQFLYDSAAKLYRLSLPLPPVANNRRVQQNLTLKAYADDAEGNRTYSAMSAPPTGFTVNINSGVKSPDFRESYPALQSLPGANPPAPPFADVPPVQEDLPPSAVIEVKNAQGDLLGTTAFLPPSGSVSVIVGDAITLDASVSTDPNTGDTLSYSWYKINPLPTPPTPPTSLNNANDNITADTSAAGSTTYQVRVKDSTNLSSTADIIVTAELGNIAPTADFEFESTGIGTLTTDPSTGNATLTLTATDDATQVTVKANANGANYKSSDSDGMIQSYAWISGVSSQQYDATTSLNGTLGAEVQDIGFFVPDATTTEQTYMYNYALTVIDDGGKSSTKTKFLTVIRKADTRAFYADYSDGQTAADYAVGSASATVNPSGASYVSATGTGLKVTAGDGNYLAYSAQNNMPTSGSLEIYLNKAELLSAGFSYLFDAVDDAGQHIEIKKTATGNLILQVGTAVKFITSAQFSSADYSALSPNIRIVTTWPTLDLRVENADGTGTPVIASAGGGTPPSLTFGTNSKFYVGSKELGQTSTGAATGGNPLQYHGFIKSVLIQ